MMRMIGDLVDLLVLSIGQLSEQSLAGMISYGDRYRDMIFRVQSSFGAPVRMDGEVEQFIHNDIASRIPLDTLQDRRRWRDTRLAALDKLKRDLK